MTAWRMFLNDKLPDCGVAACCNAMLLWNTVPPPIDADAKVAEDRFSASDYTSKVLWGWFWRGIGGNKLGGFATVRESQIHLAIERFGCAIVVYDSFYGSNGRHAVLAIKNGQDVSWGKEYDMPLDPAKVVEAYAIAPKFHPILIWWALTNNPRWFLFLAPLWWPQ